MLTAIRTITMSIRRPESLLGIASAAATANAASGRYMRRSAARSCAGKMEELGSSSTKPISIQRQRHATAAMAAHAARPSQTGGMEMAGSTVKPTGTISRRK
jgi:hypothetical protein